MFDWDSFALHQIEYFYTYEFRQSPNFLFYRTQVSLGSDLWVRLAKIGTNAGGKKRLKAFEHTHICTLLRRK